MEHDLVNHPKHYATHPSNVECIEIARHLGYALGNAFKYVWRAGAKHADKFVEDLHKAEWYLNDYRNTDLKFRPFQQQVEDVNRAFARYARLEQDKSKVETLNAIIRAWEAPEYQETWNQAAYTVRKMLQEADVDRAFEVG